MLVETDGRRVVVQAPAKVNVFLEVLGKRDDGFHELETVFLAISLTDTLVFESVTSGIRVDCDDPDLPVDSGNLVTRAANLMCQEAGRRDGVSISLAKRIPRAAGLGGGSSDAAATLVGLNTLWELGWSRERLAGLGARLGSDVPFFLYGPAAVGRGRGEILTPLTPGGPIDIALVCPAEGLSTASVFGNLRPPAMPRSAGPMIEAIEAGDARLVGERLFNRLEEAATPLSPTLGELANVARGWDCLGHQMTGSGSAYFAVCKDAEQAEAIARMSSSFGRVFVVCSSH